MAGKPKKKQIKVNYVQLEPAAFLSDNDFQMMTDSERGIYCTIIFYMYCNEGRILNDPEAIKRLCNIGQEFEKKWSCVRSKFYQKGDWLRHNRVDSELKKAINRMETSVKAGLKGAKKRWGSYSNPNGNPVAKGSKGKVSKDNISPPTPSHTKNQHIIRPKIKQQLDSFKTDLEREKWTRENEKNLTVREYCYGLHGSD